MIIRNFFRTIFNRTVFSLGLAAGILCGSIFTACDIMNQPVKEYLEKYGYVASIASVSYPADTQQAGGAYNIPGTGEQEIVFKIDNPGNFEMRPQVSFTNPLLLDMDGNVDPTMVDVIVDSKTQFRIVFPATTLGAIDGVLASNDISPSIVLYRESDGLAQSKYNASIRCNTAPNPIVTAECNMYSDPGVFNDRLVICFNPPSMDPDVKILNINGHLFDISGGGFSPRAAETWTVSSAPAGLESTYDGGTPISASHYIITDIDNLKSIPRFDVILTLVDEGGLTASTTIPSRVYKVGEITSNVSSPYTLAQDAGKITATFKLYPPVTEPDCTINYEIVDIMTGLDVAKGSGSGTQNFNLLPGMYSVVAFAQKTGYLSSEWFNIAMLTVEKRQLGDISSNTVSGKLTQNPDGSATYKLYPPAGDTDATIVYTVGTSAGGSDVYDSSKKGEVTLELGTGTYYVNAHAEKDYLDDSDNFTETVSVETTVVYMAPYPIGNNLTGNGTRANPYQTADTCVTAFTDKTNPLNRIFLLDDMSSGGNMFSGISGATFNLVAAKNGTVGSRVCITDISNDNTNLSVSGNNITIENIDFDYGVLGGYKKTVSFIQVLTGSSLTLKKCSVKNFELEDANLVTLLGTLTLDGSSISSNNFSGASVSYAIGVGGSGKLILEGNDTVYNNFYEGAQTAVYLASPLFAEIEIGSTFTGGTIGINTYNAPTPGYPVVFTTGWSTVMGTKLPGTVFVSTTTTGDVVLSGAEAALATGGGGMGPGFPSALSFTPAVSVTVDSTTGGTVTLGASDSGTDVTAECTWSLKLYKGMSFTGNTSATNQMLIPAGLPSGNYMIEATVMYNGNPYSPTFDVLIQVGP